MARDGYKWERIEVVGGHAGVRRGDSISSKWIEITKSTMINNDACKNSRVVLTAMALFVMCFIEV